MKLASVRALKREAAETIVRPLIETMRAERTFSVRTRALGRRSPSPEGGIALGVAAGKGPKDFRLAVRIQRRSFDRSEHAAAAFANLARHEADIRYVGAIRKSASWMQAEQRPLLIGCSVAHRRVTAGTLGAFVSRRGKSGLYILSNNHVLANEDRGKAGDAVLQPGPADSGRVTRHRVGELADWAPLDLAGRNAIDAAIARLDRGVPVDRTLLNRQQITLKGVRATPLAPGDPVVKLGRTTGFTRGIVTAIEMDDIVVEYETGDLVFDDQIEIEGAGETGFSAGGDSGSLILDQRGKACALLFSGGDQGGTNGKGLTYANPIASVLETLKLELAL